MDIMCTVLNTSFMEDNVMSIIYFVDEYLYVRYCSSRLLRPKCEMVRPEIPRTSEKV